MRAAMKRTPLRTTTGCDRCKQRRKKCDEARPICSSCHRLQFVCTWYNSPQHPSSNNRPASREFRVSKFENKTRPPELVQDYGAEVPGWNPSAMLSCVPIFAEVDNPLTVTLMMRCPRVFGALVSRTAPSDFHDHTQMISLAAQHQNLVQPMAALTACVSSFYGHRASLLGRGAVQSKQTVINSYRGAVVAVQRLLGSDAAMRDVVTLFAITLLGLVEVCRPVLAITLLCSLIYNPVPGIWKCKFCSRTFRGGGESVPNASNPQNIRPVENISICGRILALQPRDPIALP